ncbi:MULTISPECIES: sulfite exporter TauE/SafE family protein [Thermococcus]|uniref:Probable membrane transporter protein n=1 Tax=Thermococcus barossii TaxID=54077 RepID=A0A2Z2MG56_9EURY|nr:MULTISPECIES: sulfite exporter TauE/SafE family protein [Thermococcus]ASJ04489.1 permease [Thermococcus barossii]NJE75839.1 sulfite exporter TauE/SafE family protein [Thermococcus sp. ES12]
MLNPVMAVLIGALIGTVAGLFGVGGGFLIVPSLVFLGLPIHLAIGTSLACITISSLSSAYAHIRAGRVLYRVAFLKEVFSIPAAMVGAYLSGMLNPNVLEAVFGVLLMYVAYAFVRRNSVRARGDLRIDYRKVPLIGALSGLTSGLLGVSGGILNVPLFHTLAGLPVNYAVGTSSLALFFTALVGTATHYTLGQVDVETALLLSPGLIIGAALGARLVPRLHPRRFKLLFSALLVLVAIRLLLRALKGF